MGVENKLFGRFTHEDLKSLALPNVREGHQVGVYGYFGHFGGIPLMAKFERNLALKSSNMVKTSSNRVQNDRQSTLDNF